MPSTYLTVGGFTQPSVARHVVELPSSIEKGFTHRLKFAQLGEVHKEFTENLSEFRYHLLCVM